VKEGLDPYSSRTAAYVNQRDNERLSDLGELAQKILAVSAKFGSAGAIKLISPALPDLLNDALGSLTEFLLSKSVQGATLQVDEFALLVIADLQDHQVNIKELFESVRNLKVFVEGARKARDADSAEKVRRLSQVVTTGVMTSSDPQEKVLEFIRFAAELNETDIYILSQLYKIQHTFNPKFVSEWAQSVRKAMHDRVILDSAGGPVDDQYVRSAYARLQAIGLAVQLGGTASDTSPGEQHYALLKLGKEFYMYLQRKGDYA
jgi:hypothetical protein